MRLRRFVPFAVAALAASGCGGKGTSTPTCLAAGCGGGQVCETVAGSSTPACFDPIYVNGRVYDLASAGGIVGARVVGQDVDGAPVSAVVLSGTGGAYELKVSSGGTTRNADGSPASGSVTLRVDASGYETFPSGLRTAIPIALTSATHANGRWTVSSAQSTLVDVGLKAIASAPTGQITGTVSLPSKGGALVVAECGTTTYTAVPGSDGTYAIFNVAGPSSCSVTAYAKGVNYTPVNVTVGGGTATADLAQAGAATATVKGSVQFVSSTFWDYTSVMLVVASTYDAVRVRGIAPPGLVVRDVTNGGNWSIPGVPDGHYRVLAAFETDYLVRDPSDIGGTAVLELWVESGSVYVTDPGLGGASPVTSLQGFKITGAVRLLGPIADATGACTTLTSLPADPRTLPVGGCTTADTTPTLAWEDYSSAKDYEVTVVDEMGAVAWSAHVGTATSATPTALTAGMTYQVRVRAHPVDAAATLSTTEDLLGVFTVQ